jgi:hypothetical protein
VLHTLTCADWRAWHEACPPQISRPADGELDANSEERCGRAPVCLQEEWQDDQAGKDVANTLDPHEGKGGRIVNGNAEASGGSSRVEYEVDSDCDDRNGHDERAPEQQRASSQHQTSNIWCYLHSSSASLPRSREHRAH